MDKDKRTYLDKLLDAVENLTPEELAYLEEYSRNNAKGQAELDRAYRDCKRFCRWP